MNEQERYCPVVIKSLREITPWGHQLAHDAIDATLLYCSKLKDAPSIRDMREIKNTALEAINALKSSSTSLRLGYYSALLWLLDEAAVNYEIVQYSLKNYYKLPWDYELEAKCDRRAPARPWARRRRMASVSVISDRQAQMADLEYIRNVLKRIKQHKKFTYSRFALQEDGNGEFGEQNCDFDPGPYRHPAITFEDVSEIPEKFRVWKEKYE